MSETGPSDHLIVAELFREPAGGRLWWVGLAGGLVLLVGGVLGLFAPLNYTPSLAGFAVGLFIVSFSAAEVLPTGRRRLAAAFRSIALLSLFASVPLRLLG